MKIHIFNPENDMALADGTPGYTPPANIRAYSQRNCQLPRQWAEPDDIVWDGETPFSQLGIDEAADFEIAPWGWSPALVHRLQLAGFPREKLPTREYLRDLRILSSRVTTVAIQQELGIDAIACQSLGQVEQCIGRWSQVIMKSPWSSSGKGLMMTDSPNWRGWVKRILKLQGAVIVERRLNRLQDFAMEFTKSASAGVEYCGLSVFSTDDHGHYLSNVHATEEDKQHMIQSLLTREGQLTEIRQWMQQRLSQAPYTGPIGVDMMVCQDGTLCPCIEINWRMTMGMAQIFSHR